MSEAASFELGSRVRCRDGTLGELARVIVESRDSTVTHLVVKPRYRRHGRLVPIALVAEVSPEQIELSCSGSEFKALEPAEETEIEAGAPEGWGTLSPPYYEFRMGGGMGGGLLRGSTGARAVTHDRVPAGEVEIRNGDPVYAADAEVGRVVGLIIDRADERITHIVVEDGHLRHRRTAIPIADVRSVTDVVRLSVSKSDVANLPPTEAERTE